jgi:hypothetical protein
VAAVLSGTSSHAVETTAATAVVFFRFPALVCGSYGSSKAQDLKDAAAHRQGRQALARRSFEQMSAMREHSSFAHSLSVVRLL